MSQYHALIVDDDRFNLEILERLLQANGISSTSLADETLLESVLPTLAQVDMIFLDLELPTYSGYELLPHLRQWVGNALIVAYSVHTNEVDTAYEIGFDAFIGKPLDPKRFPDQLARLLNGQSVWEV